MEKEIINIVADTLELDKTDISLETNLIRDLDVDSLDFVDLIANFKKEFNIDISDKDIKSIQTVADIVEYFKKHN